MKMRSVVAVSRIGFMCLLLGGIAADAAELKVLLSSTAIRAVMEDLRPKFERATGHNLVITVAPQGVVVKRIQDGEIGDVVVIPRQGIDRLAKDGKVVESTVTVVAGSVIGVAVRTGAPKPDISSPEALKRTLLAAKSIAFVNPVGGGAGGSYFATVLERLGITNEMQSKTVFPKPPVTVGQLLANGEAEIGVGTFEGFISDADVEIVGPLPGDLQRTIVFSAAIMSSTKSAEASKALVNFLLTSEAAPVIKAKGMEPATP